MSNESGPWGISWVADRFDLDPDTLRYYEREGVLPAPARDGGGRRVYTAGDIELIEMLVHLKATGMPLAQIAEFTGLAASRAGGSEQVALLQRHQRAVLEQRDRLDASLDVITRKIAGYGPDDGEPQFLVRPDCRIGYAVRGCGPLLYLVGAPVGRSGFAALAEYLADEYTVVTHDPRGIDASVLRPGSAAPTPQTLADDLLALVEHLGGGPAVFFGASGGAVTVLEVAARHPELIDQVVVHEPPLIRLLHDPALERRATAAFQHALADPQAGAQEFLDLTGAGHATPEGEQPPTHTPLPELSDPELERNRYFLGRMAGPSVFYEPTLDAIRRLPLSVCAGELSQGQLARRAAHALADAVDVPLIDVPGNHLGPSLKAARFAEALKKMRRATRRHPQ